MSLYYHIHLGLCAKCVCQDTHLEGELPSTVALLEAMRQKRAFTLTRNVRFEFCLLEAMRQKRAFTARGGPRWRARA